MQPHAEPWLDEAVVSLARTGAVPRRLVATPLLQALRAAGTRHLYADTADVAELAPILATPGGLRAEVDGSTANQPLVRKVTERILEGDDPRRWIQALAPPERSPSYEPLRPLLYAVLAGRAALDAARAFGAGRAWEVSVQLHMDLVAQPETARRVGRLVRRIVPSAFVKVPFAPDAPHCFLVARDLEREGVRVNFTSTFSARQAVTAALLADVSRTNVFMGRLNQGLRAELLGEHVCLEAQRALLRLRREDGVKTQLIVASMREWQTFERIAGCDVFTAPCPVLEGFLAQREVGPQEIASRLETSYADRLGLADEVHARPGPERVARLYRVEPELIEFLRDLRQSDEARSICDGEELFKRFDQAGFGDLFHDPDRAGREELERGKLPDLDGDLVERIPLDTHYSLLGNADFARYQREIDAEIEKRIGR